MKKNFNVGVLGINHKSAPLHLREKVAKAFKHFPLPDGIILSTCYREEIYFSHDDVITTQLKFFQELKKTIFHLDEKVFYSYFGQNCFLHLLHVVSGLDSAVLAESDIQRQVKIAYEKARVEKRLPPSLHYLFQKSLKLGKAARSLYPLFEKTVRLEKEIFQLITQAPYKSNNLLLLGNSDINRKIIYYFLKKGGYHLTLSTRFLESVNRLGPGVTLKDRTEIEKWYEYDVVIAATKTEQFLITPFLGEVKTHLMVDLSVPRCIDPIFRHHPFITLIHLEELQHLFKKGESDYLAEIEMIKLFFQLSVEKYTALYKKKSMPFHFSSKKSFSKSSKIAIGASF